MLAPDLCQKRLQVVGTGEAARLTPAAYRVGHAAIVSACAGLQRVAMQGELRLQRGKALGFGMVGGGLGGGVVTHTAPSTACNALLARRAAMRVAVV